MPRLSISELLSETEAGLDLELLAGERGLSRFVQVPRIQKPGLALEQGATEASPGSGDPELLTAGGRP